MAEKCRLGNKTGHGDDLPARRSRQHIIQFTKVGNTVGANTQLIEPGEIFVAGAPGQQPRLAFEKLPPDGVILGAIGMPILRNHAIVAAGVSALFGRGHNIPRLPY